MKINWTWPFRSIFISMGIVRAFINSTCKLLGMQKSTSLLFLKMKHSDKAKCRCHFILSSLRVAIDNASDTESYGWAFSQLLRNRWVEHSAHVPRLNQGGIFRREMIYFWGHDSWFCLIKSSFCTYMNRVGKKVFKDIFLQLMIFRDSWEW